MNKPVYILGINSAYHESSACLLKDGVVVAAVEEERFNRIKHAKPARVDNPDELPFQSIDFCLSRGQIELGAVDHFAYSLLPKQRLFENSGFGDKSIGTSSWGSSEGERLFYEKCHSIPEIFSDRAGADIRSRFHYLPHHHCHAASAFFTSPFDDSAILVVDGIAEFASTWLGVGKNNKLRQLLDITYPNSIGFLWEKLSEYLGFTEYDATKVMGLSSYGSAKHASAQMEQILLLHEDGTFTVDNDIVRFRSADFDALERLFECRRRRVGEQIRPVHENVAAALQTMTERAILNLVRRLGKDSGSRNLSFAGGGALNCVANGKVIASNGFDAVYVQPAAHDAGTSLGAAYYLWNHILGSPRAAASLDAFWGPEYSDAEIRDTLEYNACAYRRISDIENFTARLLEQGHIVAWFQGKMEFGPRALGHRSILADPRNPNIANELNRKIKLREPFRPFCPSVLEADAQSWFEMTQLDDPAYYMLVAYKVREDKAKLIPAVTHVDGTARVQLVSRRTDERFHLLLEAFKELTGIPILLNTSFNIREPIVCSPQNAIDTFRVSQMDTLIMGNYVVQRSGAD